MCHFSSAKSGLPIRGGLARIAAWAWLFKRYTLRDWVRFAEAYGMPIRIGKFEPGASEKDLQALWTAVANVVPDMAAIIPASMEIEFEGDDVRGRSEIYKDLVAYIDNQLSIVVLGQTLTTEAGERGARSLGEVHDLVRRDIEHSDGKQLAATLRRDLIRPMVLLNRGERQQYPRVVIEREIPEDRALLSESLPPLVKLGLRVKVNQVREMMGFEMPKDGDTVLEPPAPPPMMDPGGSGPPQQEAMARALTLALGQARPVAVADAIDLAVAQATGDWQPLMDPVLRPVFAIARDALESGGLQTFRERLPGLLDDMDDTAVSRLLHHLTFSAELSGDSIPPDGET